MSRSESQKSWGDELVRAFGISSGDSKVFVEELEAKGLVWELPTILRTPAVRKRLLDAFKIHEPKENVDDSKKTIPIRDVEDMIGEYGKYGAVLRVIYGAVYRFFQAPGEIQRREKFLDEFWSFIEEEDANYSSQKK